VRISVAIRLVCVGQRVIIRDLPQTSWLVVVSERDVQENKVTDLYPKTCWIGRGTTENRRETTDGSMNESTEMFANHSPY